MQSSDTTPNASSLRCDAARAAYSPSTSGWYPGSNVTPREGGLDIASDGAEIAVAHVARDVDAPRSAFSRDLVRRRRHPHVCDRRERRVTTGRQIDRHPSQRKHVAPHVRRAPHHDVEDLLRVEDFAHLDAAQHGRHRVADDGRRHPDLLRPIAVERDFNLRNQRQRLNLHVGRASHAANGLSDFCGLPLQHIELGAEDPHHNRGARAGQHLLDALAQIREQVPLQTWIAIDDRLNLRNRLRRSRPTGSRLIHSSVKLIPTTSSATSARPMCAPKLRTPGTARSSLLARRVIRRIASRDVPGFSTQCIRKSYSLKCGRNSSPRNGKAHRRERRATPPECPAPVPAPRPAPAGSADIDS